MWTTPWSRPSGDIAEDGYMAFDLDLRRGSAVLDLTTLVKVAVEGGQPARGFLLTADPVDGVGVHSEELPRFAGLSGGRREVRYIRVGPPPRPER